MLEMVVGSHHWMEEGKRQLVYWPRDQAPMVGEMLLLIMIDRMDKVAAVAAMRHLEGP